MPDSLPTLRIVAFAACAAAALAIAATGGCTHATGTMAVPSPSPSATASPTSSPTGSPSPTPTANVFVSMAYASMSPTIDPTYGEVDGYAQISPPPTPVSSPTPTPSPAPSPTPGQSPGPSSIVAVPCNVNIQFLNFDLTSYHTASKLDPQGGGFPQFFNNTNGVTASLPLTAISADEFSTGGVNGVIGNVPGRSLVYTTGSLPGAYFFGDSVDYGSVPSMRTVILVQC